MRRCLPTRVLRVALAATCALVCLGCDRPAPRTPENGYRAFAEALRRGDSRTAWNALSPATQKVAEARSKRISEASKGVIKDEPSLMLMQSGTRPAPLGDIKLVSSDGGAALVEVSSPSGPQQVHMVRDGDHWAVDLSDILRETP